MSENEAADRLRAHVAHDFEGGSIEALLDEALATERRRIRELLDARHVDYWDAFDEDVT